MSDPRQLHAAAALASLRIALVVLGYGAEAERDEWTASRDGLRSWAPSTGRAGGGGVPCNPVATSATSTASTRYARRAGWTHDTLAWLAARLDLSGRAPLDALEVAIPTMRPTTAHQLTLWLRDLDERARIVVQLGSELTHVPGVACPACSVRLIWRTAAGSTVCRGAACRCTGEACRCTMPTKIDGVEHIWAAA